MGFVWLTALALVGVGSPARRAAPGTMTRVTARLARAAAALGALAVPVVLTNLAQGASQTGGYDCAGAWNSLYDGSVAGLYSGLEFTFSLFSAVLIAPLAFRALAGGRLRNGLLGAGLAAGAVPLAVTKFPTTQAAAGGRPSSRPWSG
ncbi:MAG: hypothetical protein ACRDN0_17905 [Trebonia sp.]